MILRRCKTPVPGVGNGVIDDVDVDTVPGVGDGVVDDVDTGGEADGRCCQPKTQVRNLENIIFWIFWVVVVSSHLSSWNCIIW